MPATVVLADTQDLITAGLRHLLADTGIRILAEVKKLQQLWTLFDAEVPDVLIMDHTKIDGFNLEHLQVLHNTYPSVGLLVISTDNNKETIVRLLETGVIGYLTKDCSKEEIVMALRAAIRGEKFF